MLDKKLIDKIRRVQLWARNLANDSLSGEYSSVFKGTGVEFDEFRKYVPGDDVKHIDWKVTARTRRPHVKVFKEERDLTILLLVDISSSQSFGLKKSREKVSAAAELAALFAILATKNNDRVGLVVFTDEVEHFIPPGSGKAHVFNLVRDVLTTKRKSSGTNISAVAKYAGSVMKKKGLIVVISDFQDDSYTEELAALARRHDLVCANTYDQAEINPPKFNLGGLIDPETGEFIDSNYEISRKAESNSLEAWEKMIIKLGGDPFVVRSDETTVTPLIKFLKRREARLSR